MNTTPFEEGQAAYNKQGKKPKNPYPYRSKNWVRWESGHTSAQLAEVRAKRIAEETKREAENETT